MDAAALEAAFRQRASDNAQPYIYEHDDVLAWTNEAEREACIRAKLIFDRTKPSVCQVQLAAGVTSYQLNPLIIDVGTVWLDRSAQYPGWRRHCLDRVDQSNARARFRRCRDYGNDIGWTDDFGLGNQVKMYSVDGNTLQIYGTPDATYDPTPYYSYLNLEVYRLPVEDMVDGSDEPEIPLMHHDGLVDWLLYRAWAGIDAEANVSARAGDALALFTQRFGERPSAKQMRMQAEGRSWKTPYGGIR